MTPKNRKIKTLMLLENSHYPQDSRVRREATTLIDKNYQVVVICPKEKSQAYYETVNSVIVCRYPEPPTWNGFIGYIFEYGYSLVAMFIISLFVFFRHGFDIIHAHNPPDIMVLIAMFYKIFRKKFIFDHHDLSPELYLAKSDGEGNKYVHRALIFFEKLSFRIADHVISTNQSYREIALTRGKIDSSKITIVRNGPEKSQLSAIEPDSLLRQRASILIGYIGEMGFQDGLDYFIRSLDHLSKDFNKHDFCAVLIGSGDAVESLKVLIAQLGLTDKVYWVGYQPDSIWRPLLASVDICVVPDPTNPFNDRSTMMKITDYMALSKPIVAFDLPEHRVTAGDSAIYAPANNEYEFAKLITDLIDDPGKRLSMGQLGRDRLHNNLTWDYQAEQLCLVYETLFSR